MQRLEAGKERERLVIDKAAGEDKCSQGCRASRERKEKGKGSSHDRTDSRFVVCEERMNESEIR